MALSMRWMLSSTALSARPTTNVCRPSVTFTSTVMVIASTPYTALPNVFTSIRQGLADEASQSSGIARKNRRAVSRDCFTADGGRYRIATACQPERRRQTRIAASMRALLFSPATFRRGAVGRRGATGRLVMRSVGVAGTPKRAALFPTGNRHRKTVKQLVIGQIEEGQRQHFEQSYFVESVRSITGNSHPIKPRPRYRIAIE